MALIRALELATFTLRMRDDRDDDDEVIGCRDLVFDDEQWVVRYVEADTTAWLPGRRMLVTCAVIDDLDRKAGEMQVRMTKAQLEEAPPIERDEPTSRPYERTYLRYLGLDAYWGGGSYWGSGDVPSGLPRAVSGTEAPEDENRDRLYSARAAIGYTIHAADGSLGKVADLLIDTQTWAIDYFQVDTRRWLPGRTVLIPVDRITNISWANGEVVVAATRQTVESAPEWDGLPNATEERAIISHYDGLPVPEAALINRPHLATDIPGSRVS